MTVDQIGAWCGGIVAIITACSALVVTIRNARDQRASDVVKNEKLDTIHGLVNDRMEKALSEISKLRNQVAAYTLAPGDQALARKADQDVKKEGKP